MNVGLIVSTLDGNCQNLKGARNAERVEVEAQMHKMQLNILRLGALTLIELLFRKSLFAPYIHSFSKLFTAVVSTRDLADSHNTVKLIAERHF